PRRTHKPYRSLDNLDGCPLSFSGRSAEPSRNHGIAQAMKSPDALLEAWAETLRRKGGKTAIFDTAGGSARSYDEIDDAARDFERKLEEFEPGSVAAIQIGN